MRNTRVDASVLARIREMKRSRAVRKAKHRSSHRRRKRNR